MLPFVSIIIPTYNRSNVIMRAIDSVFAQSFKNFELIIVDDGSTDNSFNLLEPLILTNKIKYFKTENLGVSYARNFGVKNGVAKYIAFLDSDDEWFPYKLQTQVGFLKENPQLRIVFGDEIWIRNGKRVNQKNKHKKSGGDIFLSCLQQCFIAPSSVMMEKNLFLEMGGFDETFPVCEDYDLWLKISSLCEVGYITNPLITKHGGHEDQLSTKYVAMDFWRLKAMFGILNNRVLLLENKKIIIESMRKRGAILLQGYEKYGNEKDFQLIDGLLKKLIMFEKE